ATRHTGMQQGTQQGTQPGTGGSTDMINLLQERVLAVGKIQPVTCFDDVFQGVLSGNTVLLLDGYTTGLSACTQGWKDRGVVEATTEPSVRGSREAFSETLRTNTSLVRRRIKHQDLRVETKSFGRLTQTNVAIMFIQGIANDKVVQEVRDRLAQIDIDGILESGYIEELIQDKTLTPFPTVYNTERPDVIAAELLEGKIAIIVDGTPSVLVVPALFVSFLHAAEDYFFRSDISTLVRILRYIGIFIALLGPSLYVAITTFHQEMLPTQLLISLAAQREGIPFPAVFEAIMMEILFELLREAGIRMPRMIGPAVSVVGTLVIGQAAVDAGIVSAAMVIVVSTTAICSFVFPAYSMSNAFRMLRFPLMLLAASFGLFGVCIGLIAIVLHLCSLRSFGVPYMSPLAPIIIKDQKDTIFRLPQWAMRTRPSYMSPNNQNRQQPPEQAKPKPPTK
ncbi:GerA spore germination protein, partial [Paenibacillus alvei TS-15]